ncbi:Receptor-like protein EIX2 [Glycine max]|nr:Receptor-like protein EIX2 [Glycine max]
MNKCVETDNQALLKLKHGFVDGSHILSSWSGEDCCKWKGISCNNLTGRVNRLDLQFSDYSAQLEGKIDSSICELQHLTFLDVSFNDLQGEIPKCIGSLTQLIELKLPGNEFVGSVPRTLANLSNLQNLDLRDNNNLVANGLEWLSHLSNLRYLGLSNVNLSRVVDWPSSISRIPSLLELYLDVCRLPQVNPKSISHLNSSTSLQIISFTSNELDSSILSWVLNVSKVFTSLDLSHNSLHSVPDGFANITLCQVKRLSLSHNKLSGQLSDYLPESCSAQHDLEELDLSHNPFSSGPLPDFSWFSSLKRLSLEYTNVVGQLSISFDHLRSLEDLDVSHNQLSGPIPYTIGQLSNLTHLYLCSNKLNGSISEAHLSGLSRLKTLDVSRNSLSFNLDPNWVPPFQLGWLSASSCILGPQFPTWLKYQRKLRVLQISNTGEIPQCLSRIAALSNMEFQRSFILYFRDGYSDDTSSLPSIEITVMLAWKGQNREFWKNLGLMTIIDLSDNHLTGGIPQSITKLVALIGLNLSGNNLTGFIPNDIGHMKMLETFDLSRNHLHGRMPKSFSNLSFLSYMNLSFNNLSGKITVSTQLQSFTAASYAGNIGLCGPPLTNLCSEDVVPPYGIIDKSDSNEDEHELVDIGFYISLGVLHAEDCGGPIRVLDPLHSNLNPRGYYSG